MIIPLEDKKVLQLLMFFRLMFSRNHNEIWENVRNSIKKEFHSEPVYNEKYLRTKIKSYKRKINTNFHNNKISNESSECICLSVILIDSVYRKDNFWNVKSKY